MKSGFTLIELLVVISLVGILSTIGLASYINFNRNQLLLQSVRKIMEDLRLTQSLASNNQKPAENCGTLIGYSFMISGKSYQINADCVNSAYDGNPLKSSSIPENFSFSGLTKAEFRVLKQPVKLTGGGSLTISGFNKSKTITVGEGGEISLNE